MPIPAIAEVFYVRPKGVTCIINDGLSHETAWVGFDNIEWGSGNEEGKVDSGDTLYICGIHSETLNLVGILDYTEPVNIRGDCNLEVGIIDGGGHLKNGIVGIHIKNVHFRSIELRGITETAIYLYDSEKITENRNIEITGMEIHGARKNGISTSGSYVTINDCEIYDIGSDGIYNRGSNLAVTNCKIYKVAQDYNSEGDCIQISTIGGDFYIANNELLNLSKNAKHCFVAHGEDSGGMFENNTCVISTLNNRSHFPIQIKQRGVTVRGNLFKGGNYGGVFLFGKVYCNVFKNTTSCGIRVLPSTEVIVGDVEVSFNVIQNCGTGIFHDSNTKFKLHNNIIIDSSEYGIKINRKGLFSSLIMGNKYINNNIDASGVLLNNSRKEISFDIDPTKRGEELLENSPCSSL